MNQDIYFIDTKHMNRWLERDDLTVVTVDHSLQRREIWEWLRGHTKGEIHIYTTGQGNAWYGDDTSFTSDILAESHELRFEDPKSAMLFKLTWA